jgi:type IV pilus assembly protein PilA
MYRNSFKARRHARGDILFGPMFFIGIIAAIAIPAYQDYTIRSQVTEGLNLAATAKVAVAEFYAVNGAWPKDLKEAGLERAAHGRYVGAVTVRNGTVVIRYGAQANGLIAGHHLTLRPTINPQRDVVWSCGYSEGMGADPATGPAAPNKTSIARKYLPAACRGNPTS